MTDCRGKHTYL